MPRRKYWRKSKAHQTLEDTKTLSSEMGERFKKERYMTADRTDRTDSSTVTEQTGTEEMNLVKKPLMLSDLTNTRGGGRDNNSAEDILTPEHSHKTFAESIAKSFAESITKSTAKSFAESIANSSAIMISESIASCSAEGILNSDSYNGPNSDSHGVKIACDKPFAAQFIESSGNDCLKTQTDFDEAFAETFPYIFDKRHACNNEELPKNKEEANEDMIDNNETPFCDRHFEIIDTEDHCDTLETYSDNDVTCYQAVRSSEKLWNANNLVFGSFHQNDTRFSEQSRGYQCTCNALCMLSYSLCLDVDNSSILDKVLCEGRCSLSNCNKQVKQ